MVSRVKAIIRNPAKTANSSGKAATKMWELYFPQNEKEKYVEPIMGWSGNNNMLASEVRLKFPTKEDAISYAKRHNIEFEIYDSQKSTLKKRSYAENFFVTKKA